MKKIFVTLIIFIFTFSQNIFSQYDTVKMQIAFKSLIYLNSISATLDGSSLDSFRIFINSSITIDELVNYGFGSGLYFFRITKLDSQLNEKNSIFLTRCDVPYVIGFNSFTNSAFRITGFETNDLLQLLPRKINIRRLDDDYYIEGVNIECLYRGLTRKETESSKKYPCLRGCGIEFID